MTWHSLALLNGWTDYGHGYQTARYGKSGDRVWGQMFLQAPASPVTGAIVATLPAGFVPPVNTSFGVVSANFSGGIQFDIDTGGNIIYQWPSIPGGSLIALNFSFTIN